MQKIIYTKEQENVKCPLIFKGMEKDIEGHLIFHFVKEKTKELITCFIYEPAAVSFMEQMDLNEITAIKIHVPKKQQTSPTFFIEYQHQLINQQQAKLFNILLLEFKR